ncbi:MAG: hypothetical protein HY904_20835 [Deltaproteobacteria bacterium]|nr:hypothetical protein [Deltaproteobacteria bacterium]
MAPGWLHAQGRRARLQQALGLSGLVGLGLFTVVHVAGMLPAAVAGADGFNTTLPWRRSVVVGVLTWMWLAVPLVVHVAAGTLLARRWRFSVGRWPTPGNWVLALRRVSAVVVGLFLVEHVWDVRVAPLWLGRTVDGAYMQRHLALTWTLDWYVLGVSATSFHLAAGAWTVLCRWGLLRSAWAQRWGAWAAAAAGLALAATGMAAAVGLHDARLVVP